jgi:hypothetical protein
MSFGEKPRRRRANLQPPSRSASVIDRLLKNQNRWKIVIIFDHPRRTSSRADVRGTAPQFCGFMDTGAHSCSDRWCSVRAVDDSTARRSAAERLARTPPRRVTRRLAASTIAPPAPTLSSTGGDSRPHHAILDRKIVARLFRRFPRPVEARIMPDSYVSSMGSAFTETA